MKKGKVLLGVIGSTLLLSSSVFASTIRPILRVNPIPVFEGDMKLFNSKGGPEVTDSDVGYYWSPNTPGDWVYAEGYVTVKENNEDYHHYTRVQIESTKDVAARKTEWGYGRVPAKTDTVEYPGDDYEGRIYYGW